MAKRRKTPARVFKLVDRRPEAEPDWSAEEMLLKVLEDVRAGKVKPSCMMIFFTQVLPDGREAPSRLGAGLTFCEALGYLELEKARVLAEWTDTP